MPARSLPRGSLGAYKETIGDDGGIERSVLLLRDLARNNPEQYARLIQHETGHLLDQVAGQMDTAGLEPELRRVYNDLNNPDLNNPWASARNRAKAALPRNYYGPEQMGYSAADVPRELVAEAYRANQANPNYLKTVAPKTAAAIRAAVNTHPVLSRYIQFNSLAAMLAGGGLGGALALDREPQ